MPPGEPPRALVLQSSDLQLVISKLARACLSFQEAFLAKPKSPAGLLCQAWMPDVVEDNQIVLKTKNMPFCVAGMGDLLALFRCISCRFAFGTTVARPATLGAPGRVYTSSEPEMCCNVQQYAKGAYLRKAEAEQCQVQSTLLLPLFISPRLSGCVGVLEIVQTSEDMAFTDVAALLATALEKCDLFTCSLDDVRRHAPNATLRTTSVLLPPQTGVLVPPETSSEPQGSGSGGSGVGGGAHEQGEEARGGDSEDFSDDGDDYDGEEDEEGEQRRGGRPGHGKGGSQRRRKGSGNPGKPGVRLTLEDLQGHFGVGLKQAAAQLGICPTTLKRACRRHGIQRWPRRQLQKVNRALDEMEARHMMQPQQHLALPPAAGALDPYGAPLDPTADTRWTTLAHFIPAYHNNAMGGGAAGYGGGFQDLDQQLAQAGMAQYGAAIQQLGLAQQQQHVLAAAVAAAQQQRQRQGPAASNTSLPDGVLPMGGATGTPAIVEVSAVSGVSTLGQPPPHAQHPQQQQQRTVTTASAPQRQLGGSSSGGGAPRAAEYLQRVAAATNYVSPFLPATTAINGPGGGGGGMGAPVVQLPGGGGMAGHGHGHGTVNLSALSVPSLPADVMPSLFLGARGGGMPVGGGGVPGGANTLGSHSNGHTDDDQVGFMDSSVLELLLTEEQRAGLYKRGLGQAAQSGPHGPGTSLSAGELLMPPSSNLSLPAMSGGLSGLSFMM